MQKIQTRIAVGSPVSLIADIKAQIQDAIMTNGQSIISIADESIRRIEVIRGEGDQIELKVDFNGSIADIN